MPFVPFAAPKNLRLSHDCLVIGRHTVLARRHVVADCWRLWMIDPEHCLALLSLAYGRVITANDPLYTTVRLASETLWRDPEQAAALIDRLPTPEEGQKIVDAASTWHGVPYADAGSAHAGLQADKKKAADCSGSTWKIFEEAGLKYSYATTGDFPIDKKVFRLLGTNPAVLQPGDVVLYHGHMAISAGNNEKGEPEVWSAHHGERPATDDQPSRPAVPYRRGPLRDFGAIKGIYRYQKKGAVG